MDLGWEPVGNLWSILVLVSINQSGRVACCLCKLPAHLPVAMDIWSLQIPSSKFPGCGGAASN